MSDILPSALADAKLEYLAADEAILDAIRLGDGTCISEAIARLSEIDDHLRALS